MIDDQGIKTPVNEEVKIEEPEYQSETEVLRVVEERLGGEGADERSKKKYLVGSYTLRGLIDDFGKYKKIKESELWKEMSSHEKGLIEDMVFKMNYGCYPDYYLAKLKNGSL